MTIKEAVARIEDHKIVHKMNEPRAIYISEALDMAIQALQKENIYDDKEHYVTISKALYDKLNVDFCDDAVSRDAVDELSKELVHTTRDKADFLCNFWEGLQKLPPVNSQKTGYWIDADGDNAICGCCNRLNHLYGTYCKHCGAKMESEENRQNEQCKDMR